MKYPSVLRSRKGVDAGVLIGIIVALVVSGIVLYQLGAEVYTEAKGYNTTHGGTPGTMATLFGGTIFIVLGSVALFKKAGLF